MSYILDALRKADAERELGTPADPLMEMHAAAVPGETAPARRPVRTWIWLAAGAAMPLAALLAWRLLAPEPEPAPRVALALPRSDAPPAPPTVPASEPASVPAAEPAPPEAAAGPAPPPIVKPKPSRPAAPAKKPEAKRAAAPVRTLAELPEELRRQVPAMTLGGSVYAPQPENRMLVVNGQVVREGTALTPELRLESIGRQTAVFSIRGQRFEVRL